MYVVCKTSTVDRGPGEYDEYYPASQYTCTLFRPRAGGSPAFSIVVIRNNSIIFIIIMSRGISIVLFIVLLFIYLFLLLLLYYCYYYECINFCE